MIARINDNRLALNLEGSELKEVYRIVIDSINRNPLTATSKVLNNLCERTRIQLFVEVFEIDTPFTIIINMVEAVAMRAAIINGNNTTVETIFLLELVVKIETFLVKK